MSVENFQKLSPEHIQQYAESTTRLALDELLKLARHVTTVALTITLAANAFVPSLLPDSTFRILLVVSTLLMLSSIIFATHLYIVVMQVIMQVASDSQRSLNLHPVIDVIFKQEASKREANAKVITRRLGFSLMGMGWSFLFGIFFIVVFVALNTVLSL